MARRLQNKRNKFPWVAQIVCETSQVSNARGREISRQDLSFEAKVWLDFIGSHIKPSKNDHLVPQEVVFLSLSNDKCPHQLWGYWHSTDSLEARWQNLSVPCLVLIKKLCDQVGIQYFPTDDSIPTRGVIDLDKKRNVDAQPMKRRRMQIDPTTGESEHASGGEEF